ncbi:MAG: MarR family transcriptional regulator [Eubacteriales bacterium]|jgi:DNA-binding MarR family transcriptional regulator
MNKNIEDKKNIYYLIKQISEKIEARGNNILKQYGLTFAQSRVLAYLDRHDGKATQKALELHLQVSHPTIVGIVTRMERDGFVRCSQGLFDKRVKNVELTDMARRTAVVLDKALASDEQMLLDALTFEEEKELVRLLTKLDDQMNQALGKKAIEESESE